MAAARLRDLRIGEEQEVDVAVVRHETRQKKDGTGYLVLTITDCTAQVTVKWWDCTQKQREALAGMAFIRARVRVTSYNNQPDYSLAGAPVDLGIPEDTAPFYRRSTMSSDTLDGRLREHIGAIREPCLRALLESVFNPGKPTYRRFREIGAAQTRHHAYRAGLLEHTLEVTDIVAAVARSQQSWAFQPFWPDLAVAGALLHDIGKVDEFCLSGAATEVEDGGLFLGHIVQGALKIAREVAAIRKDQGFPKELEEKVLHIVISHHGKGEWGSPEPPRSTEAVLVSSADHLSAELYYFREAAETAAAGEAFVFQKKLDSGFGYAGRQIFVRSSSPRPAGEAEAGPGAATTVPPQHHTLPLLQIVSGACADGEVRPGLRRIPLLGRVAAGAPVLNSEHYEGELLVEAPRLAGSAGAYYLLRVRGDSMTSDGIQDGDFVVARHQDSAEDGDLVVALLDHEGAAVKRLRCAPNGIRLESSNPAYPPIPVPDASSLRIQGRVVAIARAGG